MYGSPHSTIRKELWEGLKNIADSMIEAWCVGGDFNSVLNLHDTGGDSKLSCDTHIFNRCLLDCGLCNIGYRGQSFTWQRRNIRRRLNRVVANESWAIIFANAKVKHLPKLKSDHVSILIDFDAINGVERGNKPFRFLMPWLCHEKFSEFL